VALRAALAAAALCAAVLACDDVAGPPLAGVGAARADVRAPIPGPRGDRHARAAAGRARPIHEIEGTIVRSDGALVAVRSRDGRETRLRIGPRTTVTAPRSAPGRPARLAPGDEVRASWRSGDGEPPTALSVQVRDAARQDPWTDRG
jgi:hypothetical protein